MTCHSKQYEQCLAPYSKLHSWGVSTPLICYILICKSRSRSNLPKSLLLTHTLQASVKSSYHPKKGLNNWNIKRYKIVWKLLYTLRQFSMFNWTWMPLLFNLHKIALYRYSNQKHCVAVHCLIWGISKRAPMRLKKINKGCIIINAIK